MRGSSLIAKPRSCFFDAKFTHKNRPEYCLAASQQIWRPAAVFGHVIGYVCIAPEHRNTLGGAAIIDVSNIGQADLSIDPPCHNLPEAGHVRRGGDRVL